MNLAVRVISLSIGLIVVAILLAAQALNNPVEPVRARELHPSSEAIVIHSSGFLGRACRSEAEGQYRLVPRPLSSMAQRLSQIKSDADSEEQNDALAQCIAKLRAEELPGLLEEIQANPERFTPELYALVYRHWAEVAPQNAAEYAFHLADASRQLEALEQTAIAWANEDSLAAQEWVSGMVTGPAREVVTRTVAHELAGREPDKSMALALELPATEERDALLEQIIAQAASMDVRVTLNWVMALPDSALRQRLLGAALSAFAEKDGHTAAALVADLMTAGPDQDRAAMSVAQRWVQTSPELALQWIGGFRDDVVRATAEDSLRQIFALAGKAPD